MDESPNEPVAATILESPSLVAVLQSREKMRLASFILIIPCYVAINFLVILIATTRLDQSGKVAGEIIASLWSGAIFGQVCFLTIWAVLGPFRLWLRWSAVLLSGCAIYYSFLLSMIVSVGYPAAGVLQRLAATSLFIPLGFLIAQFPLWIRKSISGWRIMPIGEVSQHSATDARQFEVKHILGLMVFLGVALSLVQVAIAFFELPNDHSSRTHMARHMSAVDMWTIVGVTGGTLGLYVVLWTGPCLRACFLARDKFLGCFAVAVGVVVISLSLFSIMAIIVAASGNSRMPGKIFMWTFPHLAAAATVLMASLHLVRFTGYTMIRRTKAAREPDPTTVTP